MLPILMYHGLHADEGDAGHFEPVYSVRPQAFAAQLDHLARSGRRTIRLDQLDQARDGDVVISFDDGDVSNVRVALPLLAERGMVAEFFVTSDFVGTPDWLAPADIATLVEAGMGVQAHGRSHRFLEDLDEAAMRAELADSRAFLQGLGAQASAVALPGGRGGARERRAALDIGYRQILTSIPGCNRRLDAAWLERIAITRALDPAGFAALVEWKGVAPRWLALRHALLALPKRALGNARYAALRQRLLRR